MWLYSYRFGPILDRQGLSKAWLFRRGSGSFQLCAVTGRKGEGLNEPQRGSGASNRHAHVTVHTRGGFSHMAPLPNRSRCKSSIVHRAFISSPLCSFLQSIVQVTLVCISGYVLARRGILDRATQKVIFYLPSYPSHLLILLTEIELYQRQFLHSLSPLLQSRFLPLAGFAAIPMRLTNSSHLFPEKLKELWIVPIFFLLVTGTSLGVAWLLGNLFRLRPSQRYPSLLSAKRWTSHASYRNFAMAAATFMNSNSLPVALLQSLAATVPELKWGEDDTKDAIIGRALTYLLLCSTIGQFVRRVLSQFAVRDSTKEIIDSLELWCSPALQGRSTGGNRAFIRVPRRN
jgi:predicted permease